MRFFCQLLFVTLGGVARAERSIELIKNITVTAPSTTPENEFVLPGGKREPVSIATAMDRALIRDLFTNLIEASERLNVDAGFKKTRMQSGLCQIRTAKPVRVVGTADQDIARLSGFVVKSRTEKERWYEILSQ